MNEYLTSEQHTVAEVASYLKISVQSARALIKSNQLVARKIGRQYRVSRANIEQYLDGLETQELAETWSWYKKTYPCQEESSSCKS